MRCHTNLAKVKAAAYMLKYENELADHMSRKKAITKAGRCGFER